MNFIIWLIVGGVIGWLASILMKTNDQQGMFLNVVVGVIGAMQAAEALKLISGAAPAMTGRLLMLDGRTMEWNTMKVPRDPACVVCGKQ